jgi:biopolymer transport protein ExbD
MSHGSVEKNEPNLTPLLDVVLQLVMFFMISANFVMEQVNQELQLPVATAAKPTEKTDTDPIILNVLKDGTVEIARVQYKTVGAVESALRDEMRIARELARQANRPGDELRKKVVIRADRNADFGQIFPLLRVVRTIGFTEIQLRAYRSG